MTGIVIVLIVYVVIAFVAAAKFDEIANMKGHQGYFVYCLLLGIIGWLMVVALPDRKQSSASDKSSNVSDELPEL